MRAEIVAVVRACTVPPESIALVTSAIVTRAIVTAIGTADVAATLTIVSGNGQAAPADSTLGTPLTVKVTDQFGNAVAGATVNWSSDDGGILANTTTVTDANGVAQDTLTLGERGTDDVAVAVIVGTLPLTATFTEQAM